MAPSNELFMKKKSPNRAAKFKIRNKVHKREAMSMKLPRLHLVGEN